MGNETRDRKKRTAAWRCALVAAAGLVSAAPGWANDVVIDEVINCSIDLSCADVFQVKCPQRSRYLCAAVENPNTTNSSARHTFFLSSIGTAPAAFAGVGGMVKIPPQEDNSVCLTKPMSSAESSLRGVVTVTRTFSGVTMLDGPAGYRLTAFCVSDEDGANKTVASIEQDQ